MVKIQTGDILVFSSQGKSLKAKIFSSLIKINNFLTYPTSGTNMKWTHTGIVHSVDRRKGTCVVAEATVHGFRTKIHGKQNIYGLKGLSDLNKEGNVLIGRTKKKIQPKKIQEAISELKGRPYGYLDIFQIGIHTILSVTQLFLPRPVAKILNGILLFSTGSRKLICSEAVGRVLYRATDSNIDLSKEFRKKMSYVTPLDIVYSEEFKWYGTGYTNGS